MTSEEIISLVIINLFVIGALIRLFKPGSFSKPVYVSKKHLAILDKFYSRSFLYYQQLPPKLKSRFLVRAFDLSRKLHIVGRGGFKVSLGAKLFVAAAQTQLTFGFRRYFLYKYRSVFIYPDAFLNKETGNMHYGEVNPKGLIVLSWKNFIKGYKNPHDRLNLGLHELAHALMLTIIHTDAHDAGLDHFLMKIIKLSNQEISKIKNGEAHLFRKYAGTNSFEFFAITIENFFEAPLELKKQLPKLYSYTSTLLKQDPANGIYAL